MANTVVLEVHWGRDVRVKDPSVKSSRVVLKKVRNVDSIMDPRADSVVAFDTSHERVPGICMLVQIAAPKGIWVAQTKAIKRRPGAAGENSVREGEPIQRGGRG